MRAAAVPSRYCGSHCGSAVAKPFSHIIDYEAEALRFDPDGEYVRRWLPVLSRLPTQYIHAPWKAPAQV